MNYSDISDGQWLKIVEKGGDPNQARKREEGITIQIKLDEEE